MTDNASQPRARWLLVALALAAALFLVVASACGGDDDEEDSGDNAPTATESTDGGDDSGDDSGDDGDDSGDDGGDDGGDAADELAALAGEYERFEGYVKYEASDFTDDAFTSMAIYQKGDSSRIDIESSEGDVILINTPDATYMCTEGQCLKSPADDTTAGGVADAFASFIDPSAIEDQFGDLPEGVDYDVSSDEIAGIDATCFSASGDLDEETAGDEAGEVCFSDNGLLLRIRFSGAEDSGTLEAVEAGDVPDDAFEPPFEVVDLSDLGQ